MSAHPWRWILGALTALLLLAWGAVVVRRMDDARAAEAARAEQAVRAANAERTRGDSIAAAHREDSARAVALAVALDSLLVQPPRVVYVRVPTRATDGAAPAAPADSVPYVPKADYDTLARTCRATVTACQARAASAERLAAAREREAASLRDAVDALRAAQRSAYGPRVQAYGAGGYDVVGAAWELGGGVQVRAVGPLHATTEGVQPLRQGERGRLMVGGRWYFRL